MSKFEVYHSRAGYRWRLKANNGVIVAIGDQFVTKEAAMQSVDTLRRAASDAEVVETDG